MTRGPTMAGMMCVAVACAATLPAQTPRIDRRVRPIAPPAAPFTFQETHAATLPNGLRIVVVENHALPVVAVRAVVGVDSLDDPPGKTGLYKLTAALLPEGTTPFGADQLADSMAALGTTVAPFRFTTMAASMDRSLAVMAAMLEHPTFPAAALAREKTDLTRLAQQRQHGSAGAIQLFYQKILGADHPLARSIDAVPADIAGLTRDDVVRFHDTYFRPNNTTLIIVGDVRAPDVVAAARARFGDWTRAEVPTFDVPPLPPAAPTTIYLVDRPNAAQTLTVIGSAGPPRTSPDTPAIEVLAAILGTAPGSRLHHDLRERHSYYYGGTPFGVLMETAPEPSMLFGAVPVVAAKTDSALIAWLADLREASRHPPSDSEVSLGYHFLEGQLVKNISTDDALANELAYLAHEHESPASLPDYARAIAHVTAGDVAAAAAKYVDVDHLVIVLMGDRKTLEPKLRAANIAPVVIVDDR